MNHILAIYDNERKYSRNLAGYINAKTGFPFVARFVNSSEELEELVRTSGVDVLLINQNIEGIRGIIDDCKIVYMYGRDGKADGNGMIYKYQNCEVIINLILKSVSKRTDIGRLVTRTTPLSIIGLYSPVHRVGQTSVALAMGRMLAKNVRTLYLSTESNSGIEELMGFNSDIDLCELVMEINNHINDTSMAITASVNCKDNLDLLPSARDTRDLKTITAEEWKNLITGIETETDYEYLIIDVSDVIQGYDILLGLCDRIYVTTAQDVGAEAKINHFFGYMDAELSKMFQEKMVKICVDDERNNGILQGSVLNNRVREILVEDDFIEWIKK